MAASIYATPPPDLSSEDTALSDVSNSSTLNTNRGNTTQEASAAITTTPTGARGRTEESKTEDTDIGAMSPNQQLDKETETELEESKVTAGSNTNESLDDGDNETGMPIGMGVGVGAGAGAGQQEANAMAAMAVAANAAAMQLQLLEALNDAAKKRRKQHNPSRLDALNLSGGGGGEIDDADADADAGEDYEEKLSKMFLPKSIEQLKETFEMLQHQQQKQQREADEEHELDEQQDQDQDISQSQAEGKNNDENATIRQNPYQTFCKECGENFETEFKLSLHMLQDHGNQDPEGNEIEPMDFLASIKVKLERETDSPQQHHHQSHDLTNGHAKEQELWFNAMTQQQAGGHPGFPFGPDAAAAAAALGVGHGGYLPLLGMPGFPGVDGLNRPPLRIFNPEAYCELCNKEFCNKYFLKTHKANKHGIFDPVGDGGISSSTPNPGSIINNNNNNNNNNNSTNTINNNNGNPASLMFQMPSREIAAPAAIPKPEQQQAGPGSGSSAAVAPPSASVHCDICSKRFTNVFAMRRHRAKQHDQQQQQQQVIAADSTGPATGAPPQSSSSSSSAAQNTLQSQRDSPNEALIKQEEISEMKPFKLPDGFREDFTLEQEDMSFAPQPRKMSSHLHQQARDSNFSPDKLRRLGVQYPEYFCEICFKEYANRYFLRTHKWKRHGIFVPPEESAASNAGKDLEVPPPQMNSWPFMPLNLMLAKAAAASMEQNDMEQDGKDHLEQEQQPSKRIKLEPLNDSYDDEKTNGGVGGGTAAAAANPSSVVGLQNLQKLQSMLQQLNDFNGKRPLPCHLCGRELEHQYALRAHLMTEHAGQMQLPLPLGQMPLVAGEPPHPLAAMYGQSLPKLSPGGSVADVGPMPIAPSPTNELRCQPCERDFSSPQEFKQHIAEMHLTRSGSLMPGGGEGFFTPADTRPALPAAGVVPAAPANRPAYTITPTSSYCEICNKELCNKYFMKTHMQRMHGIEIENGAQIGGVVCNICNKELCSKYFLRVHKHNTHGIVEEGSPLPQPRGQNGVKMEAAAAAAQQQQQLLEQELNLSPPNAGSSQGDGPGEICPLCARQFRSFKWLRTHLISEHGPAGLEKLRDLEPSSLAGLSNSASNNSNHSSKPNSPTLKIPNGHAAAPVTPAVAAGVAAGATAPNLAQALQNLNAQHLFGQMQQQLPKGLPLPGLPNMFAGAEQQSQRFKEYQCSLCPFTTPYYAFLFIHERSHALLNNGQASGEASENNPPSTTASSSSGAGGSAAVVAAAAAAAATEMANLKSSSSSSSSSANSTKSKSKSSKSALNNDTMMMMDHALDVPTNLSINSHSQKANSPIESPKAHSRSPKNRSTSSSSPNSSPPKGNTPNGLVLAAAAASLATLQQRSAATSPFEDCNQLANGSGKPVSYAQPEKTEEAYQMQAFHLQPVDAEAEIRFAPALVYLPVRGGRPTESSAIISFRLTPA
ncbi:uncharacterized protein Dwil_GK17741 [Drosophila willistoni]|uniref:C2H2-type domain-containing protein n=1 Tax=Drosophila willistoni TaxID=7260 RepID=B4N6F7_DROWI|nr:uncharacterized protein Dwil_GK17741 [Drosophila willistoni]